MKQIKEKLGDGKEGGVQTGFKQIAPDLLPEDFARFGALTTEQEFKSFVFQNGDVCFVFPKELTGYSSRSSNGNQGITFCLVSGFLKTLRNTAF